LKEAVAEVRAAGKKVVVATPRIIKPNEERLLNFYLRLGADALLVRSLGFLNQLIELRLDESEATGEVSLPGFNVNVSLPELRGDFSLNAANAISSDTLLRAGLSRLTPTHDLNAKQIATMAKVLGSSVASKLEVIIHQHMPVFHTEHCVFCRFLSDGNSYKDCGHPCEKNSVSLRSFDGQDHLVLADMVRMAA
jgi:collagenase-like PrtC family protease